jgi:hypothetical protein
MFMFDVETLGVESTSIVLSAAIIKFSFDDTRSFGELVESACVVKFDAKEQKQNMGRVYSQGTLDWWKKQSDLAKSVSFRPCAEDLPALEGIEKIRKYMNDNGGCNQIIWARGSLDQMVFDSLCYAAGAEPIARFNKWRDVRTAVDIIATESSDGYCKVKNFNADLSVIKHIPQHDCALDIMMLVHHE